MLVHHHNRRVTSVDGRRKRKEKERTAFSHEYLNDRNQHAGFYPDNFLHQAQPLSLASFRADRPDKLRKDKINTLSTLRSLFPFRRRSVSMFRANNKKLTIKRDRYARQWERPSGTLVSEVDRFTYRGRCNSWVYDLSRLRPLIIAHGLSESETEAQLTDTERLVYPSGCIIQDDCRLSLCRRHALYGELRS